MQQILVLIGFLTALASLLGVIAKYKNKIKWFFIGELELRLMRLELQQLIEHHPSEKTAIMTLFTEYKDKGGNCYLDAVYDKWKCEYAK